MLGPVIRVITFIAVVVSLCLAALPLNAQQPVPARIKIDIDRTIGEVHPNLFGNFTEHLGRMIMALFIG